MYLVGKKHIVGKDENAGNQRFLSSSIMISKCIFSGSIEFRIMWQIVNTFHTIFSFNYPNERPLENIVSIGKMLVTNISSFPPNVFYPSQNKFQFLAHLSTECSVSYCDHSPSVVVRPSVIRPSTICLLTL